MRLKGILWKPGINGLGVLGFHKLPYRKRFDKAARDHDKDYDFGGGKELRFLADITFLKNCLTASRTDVQSLMAIVYYILVRLFGWAFFRFDR